MYPKFTKTVLIGSLFLCAAGLIISFVGGRLGFHGNFWVRQSGILGFLLIFPLYKASFFISDPIKQIIEKVGFSRDDSLQKFVAPLLVGINPKPMVGRYRSNEINAFTISSIIGKRSIIAFSEGLLASMSDKQILAIAGHEVAHVKNGDSVNKTFLLAFHEFIMFYPKFFSELSKSLLKYAVFVVVCFAVVIGVTIFLNGDVSMVENVGLAMLRVYGGVIAGAISIVAAFFIADKLLKIMYFSHSRAREFVADSDGAAMTSREDMISVLELLTDSGEEISVFDTHPPVSERKRRLLDLASPQ